MTKADKTKKENTFDTSGNDNEKNKSFGSKYDLTFMDQFRFIDGRRFHNENSLYFLPNDEKEMERLNMQHYIFKFVWQSNFSSPVGKLLIDGRARVLDVGCGPGAWILDMATTYPSSTFLGVDLSPIFQTLRNENDEEVVRNAGFLTYNVLNGLPFPVETFDFVHQRFLSTSFTLTDWTKDINELVRVTKSGGWIELMEFKFFESCGGSMKNEGPATKKITEAFNTIHQSKNIFLSQINLTKLLADTNQVTEIQSIKKSAPVGKWGGRIGELMALDLIALLNSLKKLLKAHLKLSDDQFDKLLVEHNAQIEEYKTYVVTQRFFCRKL